MMYDPDGHLPKWAQRVLAGIAVVAAITTVVVLSVATAGAAAPVIAGALIGGTTSAGFSMLGQYLTTGSIDWN